MSSRENLQKLALEYRQSGQALLQRRDELKARARREKGAQRRFNLYQRVALLEQMACETFSTAAQLASYYDEEGEEPVCRAI